MELLRPFVLKTFLCFFFFFVIKHKNRYRSKNTMQFYLFAASSLKVKILNLECLYKSFAFDVFRDELFCGLLCKRPWWNRVRNILCSFIPTQVVVWKLKSRSFYIKGFEKPILAQLVMCYFNRIKLFTSHIYLLLTLLFP